MKKNTPTRGEVTTKDITKLCELLSDDYDATTSVPKLLLYIDYVSKNGGHIDLDKITYDEISLIEDWRCRGFLDYKDNIITLTNAFYQMMCQILWEAYVNH